MQLVYCQKCRNPIGKVAPGSKVEIKCHRCSTRTYFEAPPEYPVAAQLKGAHTNP